MARVDLSAQLQQLAFPPPSVERHIWQRVRLAPMRFLGPPSHE